MTDVDGFLGVKCSLSLILHGVMYMWNQKQKVKLTETEQKSGCQGPGVGNKKRLVLKGPNFSANKMNEL